MYQSGVWPIKVSDNNGREEKDKTLFHVTDLPLTQSLIQVEKETQLIHKLEV